MASSCRGPPGTGKTHTIANLICHAMALGQRVLVVSRGEAALAVLRDQLPEKVRPLVISILSNERQGLRQVETAIREIQSVVEESRPEIRLSAIRRCEAEILKIRARLAVIDAELDGLAERQMQPLGPLGERPADVARRLLATREQTRWFTDRPELFRDETHLADADMAALGDARAAVADILDHIDADLPPLAGLPGVAAVLSWHADMRQARALGEAHETGPAGPLRIGPAEAAAAERLGGALRDLAAAREAAARQDWLEPILALAGHRDPSPWPDMLRDIAAAFRAVEGERTRLVPFAVELPDALVDDEAARAAVTRAAAGERTWPRLSVGKSQAKELVAEVRVRGRWPEADRDLWGAVAAQLRLADDRRALAARWRAFAIEAGVGPGSDPGTPAPAAQMLARLDAVAAALSTLGPAARTLPQLGALSGDPGLARALAAQVEGAAASVRLAAADGERQAAAALFRSPDRTSVMGRQFFGQIVGRDDVAPERIEGLWGALVERIGAVEAAAGPFATIRRVTDLIAAAGAPAWADRLRAEPPAPEGDALLAADWPEAWDSGAAELHLARLDGRERLLALSRERDAEDRRGRRLFVELVRERAFLALDRRLSATGQIGAGRICAGSGPARQRHRQGSGAAPPRGARRHGPLL